MNANYWLIVIENWVLKQRKIRFLFLITLLSLIRCLILFFIIGMLLGPGQKIGYFPDTGMYETIANNIFSGNGFSLSTTPPFKPTMSKEPLYPFFIGLIKLLPFCSINFLIFIQIFLNPLIPIFIYFIGKEVFTERIARFAALLIVFLPIYGEISFFIMPESLFTVLLCATLFAIIKADKYKSLKWFIYSGLLLGLASLCRNVALPLFIIFPVVILLKNGKVNRKQLVLKLCVFVLSFLTVTAPWMYRNQEKLGMFFISRRGGGILSHQAYYAANFSREEWKAYTLYLLSGSLAQKLYPKIIGKNLGDYEYSYLAQTTYVDGLLDKYPEGQVDKILMRQAISNIMSHPIKYSLISAIVYLQSFKYFESILLMLIKGKGFFVLILSLIRFIFFAVCIVYSLIAFLGAFYSRKLFECQLILATVLYFHLVLTNVGIIPGSLQRHILPVTVFYSFFVIFAVDRIIQNSACDSVLPQKI